MGERANHLEGQTSPYLLQHLYNPVDWYPWGAEALERARREDRPIFLSIGYAACHWCHVMERESFESPEVADLLNRHFVPIKVDREERPDIDEIYMNAVQLMTGAGGWPLSVFLTPDLRPFMGGTYFPPETRHGMIGFPELLARLRDAWTGERRRLDRSAEQLTDRLRSLGHGLVEGVSDGAVGRRETARAVADLTGRFDAAWGGFGGAPKFPADGSLALLLREHAGSAETMPWRMVERTLECMACGGIYDQIGGGFARYSVDEKWLVPHFEKMLYNQALLVPLYLDAWRVSGRGLFRRVAEETLDFVRRELTDARGGFHSSLDADSEGHEGVFYLWTPEQLTAELGEDDARRFAATYGITEEGNFEGRNIPHLLGGAEEESLDAMAPLRERLLAARARRVRPRTDDKVLTAWNGLMISALARGHQVLGRDEDLVSARRAADFALGELLRKPGRLLVSYREGRAALNAYLDDYAFLGRGLLDLYETCFERRYIEAAAELASSLIRHFEDREHGGFYFTSDDHERTLTRNRSLHDGALPSGAAVAVELLLRLGLHLDDDGLRGPALRCLESYQPAAARAPSAFGHLLCAADWAGEVIEVAIIGDPGDPRTRALLEVVRRRFLPRLAVALARPGEDPGRLALLAGKNGGAGHPLAYVCRNYSCRRPTTDPDELAALLGNVPTAPRGSWWGEV